MDQAGCERGWATDKIFNVKPASEVCQESMTLFWTVIGIACTLRLGATIFQIRVAFIVLKQRKENGGSTFKNRIPWTTVMETMHSIIVIIGWFLYGFNIVNAGNGTGPALFMIGIVPLHVAFMLSCLKLVHLGNRIIPRKVRRELVQRRKTIGADDGGNLESVKADKFLVFLFATMIISQLLAAISQVLLGTLINPGASDLFTRIGMGLQGVVNIAFFLIIWRQTYRVVAYINSVRNLQKEVFDSSLSTTGVSERALKNTVFKLQLRAVMVALSESVALAFFICCTAGVIYGWKVLVCFMIISIFGSIGSTFMYLPASMVPSFCAKYTHRESRIVTGSSFTLKSSVRISKNIGTLVPSLKEILPGDNLPTDQIIVVDMDGRQVSS